MGKTKRIIQLLVAGVIVTGSIVASATIVQGPRSITVYTSPPANSTPNSVSQGYNALPYITVNTGGGYKEEHYVTNTTASITDITILLERREPWYKPNTTLDHSKTAGTYNNKGWNKGWLNKGEEFRSYWYVQQSRAGNSTYSSTSRLE